MWLTFRSGGDEGETVEVTGERFVVGRDEGANLVIHDDKVSRQHAFLRAYPDGRAELHDMGSANGTYVNGHLIRGPVLLQGNEQLQFGDTVLTTSLQRPSAKETTIGVVPAEVEAPGRPSPSAIERIKLRRASRRATIVGLVAIAAVAAVVVLFVTGVFTGGGSGSSAVAQADIPTIAENVKPSTVQVLNFTNNEPAGSGTGWVLSAEEGLIVTNAHVTNGGTSFQIRLADTQDIRDATLVGTAPCEDLSVLKVGNTAGLKTLPLGNQDDVKVGQTVVVVGFPGSASRSSPYTVTTGVVSVNGASFDRRALDVPQYPNVIQTDAAINPGNSGGPMVDGRSELVGVNSAGITLLGGRTIQGQGYAIGVRRVREITDVLRTGRSIGFTGMGFTYPTEREDLSSRGLPVQPGLIVESVLPGSPAEAAGFGRAPVLITAVNGVTMDGSLPAYCDAVRDTQSGQPITFTVIQRNSTVPQDVAVNLM